jgi:anti-sigma factor RsiW
MSAAATTRLMHAVLDGEATPAEARELEGLLEADPALRERYAEWQTLFDAMQHMPRAYPPEGLVAAVMANIPHSPAGPGSQLPAHSRVIGVTSETHRAIPATSAPILRTPRAMAPPGGMMSDQQNTSSSKRRIWIGAGIAAIAVIVVGGYALDVPPASKDAVGTIVPAQRFMAPQPKAEEIQVGQPGKPRGSPIEPSASSDVAAAAQAEGAKAAGQRAQGAEAEGMKAAGQRAQGAEAEGMKAAGQRAQGAEAEGMKAAGQRAQGAEAEGMKAAGQRAQGALAEGSRAQAAQAEGSRAQGAQAEGNRAQGAKIQ